MAKGKYTEYLPGRSKLVMGLVHHDFTDISGFTFPARVYLDRELVNMAERRDANMWRTGIKYHREPVHIKPDDDTL